MKIASSTVSDPASSGDASGSFGTSIARGFCALFVPVFPGDAIPFGPRPAQEVVVSVLVMTALCAVAGYFLTRTPVLLRLAARLQPDLRDEAWEEVRLSTGVQESELRVEEDGQKGSQRRLRKRTATELLFIAVHNGAVATLAALAWFLRSPSLAMHAFCLEVAYEVFDTYSLGMQRLEPETLIHHVVSPICILCSTQTEVDFRVLCHLCICIDASGSILGYSKFLLNYAHVSASQVYRNLTWVYAALRVVLPLVDTAIIMRTEVIARGGLFRFSTFADGENPHAAFGKTDWTQLYFWAMAVLNSFNIYFFLVIRTRAKMPAHIVANLEARMGCR